MAWRTKITEDYGIEFPFVSAGMGFIALPPLVSAVSNAGGLGLLGVAPAPADGARAMIQITKQMTAKPFGVDLVIAETMFGPSTTDAHIDACIDEGVKLVVFFWNLPARSWVEKLKTSGTRVWVQVGTVQSAREAVNLGADAIIAQGKEAGGHNHTDIALSSLVPAIVDAIAPVPVIAAGGIADGRTAAAGFALGAAAICVGTRLIASDEAYAHQEYKRRVIAASAFDTTKTSIFGPEWPDQPMRVLHNRVVRDWIGKDNQTPHLIADPIGRTLLGGQEYPMPKFSAALPTPDTSGDFEEMCLPAGESAGLVHEIRPAGSIIEEMMSEAAQTIRQLQRLVAD